MPGTRPPPGSPAGGGLPDGPAGYSSRMSATLAAHDHVWHLQAVHLEEGLTTQEFSCTECGAVDFR